VRGIFQQKDLVAQRHQHLRLINQAERQLGASKHPLDATASDFHGVGEGAV
jgi:hypothetical protein